MATSLKVNAASFISPGDLAKAQHMIDREASKSGEILMRTAAHSIASGIRHWASSNQSKFQSDIDKALQPFLNTLQKQVVKSLGGANITTTTTQSSGAAGASIISQAQWNAMPSGSARPNMRTGGGGGGAGHAAKEAFGIAMTMEAVHTMYEQIAEVRNEMYSGNIKASNLQRQLGLPASKDIRGFTESIAKPGMEMGYTKTEAIEAAQTLIRSGGSRTAAETAGANKAMLEFANLRGYEATDWAGVVSGGQRAGLFGAGAGNLGYGAKGIEEYQTRAAGLYGIASQHTGGNRGTTEFLDTFTDSLNSLASALGDATGNSEDAAKSFDNLDVKGNVYSMFSALQGTGNQAFTGQKGVQLLSQVNSSIQNQVFGSPMQQAMAFATHPGMSMGQIFAAQSKGLTDPKEFASQMKFINANYKGEDRELALHQLYGTSYGAGKALEEIYAKTGGKGTTKDELEAASKIQGYGESSQAKTYRTAMDALTKSMEEMSQILAPVIVGFDKLQGATHGLAGIFLLTLGAMKGKSFLEQLLPGSGKKHHGGLIGDLADLAKGKGQPVYVTNDCLKVCGSLSGGSSGVVQGAENVAEGAAATAVAKKANIFGRVFKAYHNEGLLSSFKEIGNIYKEEGGFKGFIKTAFEHGPMELFNKGRSALGSGWSLGQRIMGHIPGMTNVGEGLARDIPRLLSRAGPAISMAGRVGKLAARFNPFVDAVLGGISVGQWVNDLPEVFHRDRENAFLKDMEHKGWKKQWHNAVGNNIPVLSGLSKFLGIGYTQFDKTSGYGKGASIPANEIGNVYKKGDNWFWKKDGKDFDLGTTTPDGIVKQESERTKKVMEAARLAHTKAANKEWEKMLSKALDPNNPLSGVVKATMTGDWGSFLKDVWNGASKFFKGFIKNLGDLWKKLFGDKPAGDKPHHDPAPHHSTHTGDVAATTTSGGSTVTLAPLKVHITVQDSHGHTTTKVIDHHPLRHVATPHKITIGPQHHTQPHR